LLFTAHFNIEKTTFRTISIKTREMDSSRVVFVME